MCSSSKVLHGIEVAAIPASMSIDLPDTGAMTDDINTLSKAISELHGGVGSLRNGAHELADGIVQLGNGSSQFQKGMSEVAGAGLIIGIRFICPLLHNKLNTSTAF